MASNIGGIIIYVQIDIHRLYILCGASKHIG